jgi:hypothetical protein
MYNVNPMQLIMMIKQGQNPQQLLMNVLQTSMRGTPMGDNLINLAQQGNKTELEKIARNLAQQRGLDFDTEFNAFKSKIGLK